jgi:hypothetical protein
MAIKEGIAIQLGNEGNQCDSPENYCTINIIKHINQILE